MQGVESKNPLWKGHEYFVEQLGTAQWFSVECSLECLQILKLHVEPPNVVVQYHIKVLLNSFHLNGHTLGFHRQI